MRLQVADRTVERRALEFALGQQGVDGVPDAVEQLVPGVAAGAPADREFAQIVEQAMRRMFR